MIELSDVVELVKNYENAIKSIVSLSKRLSSLLLFIVVSNFNFNQKQLIVINDFSFKKSFVVNNQKQFIVADVFNSEKFFAVVSVVSEFSFEKPSVVAFSIVSKSTPLTIIENRQQFVVVISQKFIAASFVKFNKSISSNRLLKWKN